MGIDKRAGLCYNFSMNSQRIFSYEPVIDDGCRTLILGTMPSVKSIEAGFYYMHPRNAFWRIMAEVLNEEAPQTVEERKNMLLRHGVALWDTARSCVRKGSLDAAMKEIELNDFESLFEQYPKIDRVLLNGSMAWRLYRRLPDNSEEKRDSVRLPSTSPACTMPYERKLILWRDALLREENV